MPCPVAMLSAFASIGNKADVSSNDLLEYWEDDPETDALNATQKDNWEGDLGTPLNTRGKRSKSNATNAKGNNLTLRDQEKVRGHSRL